MNQPDKQLLHQATQAVQSGRLDEARAIGQQLRARHPRHPRVLALVGWVAFGDGDYTQAEALLMRAASGEPKNPGTQLILGELHTHQGRYREAIARYDRALKLQPDSPVAITGKSDAYEKKGDYAKARELLRPWFEQHRHTPAMSVVQARLDLNEKRYDDVIRLVEGHLLRGDAPTFALWHLCFLLGQALERSGRYDEAFDAYRRAHSVVPAPFDAALWTRHTTRIIDAFDRARLAGGPRSGNESDRPIFIVGMPRSGSTLVESILAAHPDVFAAGEITTLPSLTNSLAERFSMAQPYPDCVHEMTAAQLDEIASSYLDGTGRQAGDARRVTDKFLGNFAHVGFMRMILPRATIIHSRRDPIDTCLSCYTQPLMPNAHPWAADQAALGVAYREYERLMAHWREVLDDPPLDVQYEQIVADPETESRRIVEACGLPWDDACLRFHESQRDVRTASYQQVRKPVYGSSVGRAARFGDHLDPLRDALARPEP
ncbi:MAG: tetratricopeptide repeat-containing sulfotransferase family protein [Planctomycetota bacterium]|jgi:tetratricopeptide (TPR) repeat protein